MKNDGRRSEPRSRSISTVTTGLLGSTFAFGTAVVVVVLLFPGLDVVGCWPVCVLPCWPDVAPLELPFWLSVLPAGAGVDDAVLPWPPDDSPGASVVDVVVEPPPPSGAPEPCAVPPDVVAWLVCAEG